MQFLLDTNVWINYLKDPSSGVSKRLLTVSPKEIVTCSIVLSELLHGAEKYGNRHKRVATVKTLLEPFLCLPFDEIDARITQVSAMIWSFEAKSLVLMIFRLPPFAFDTDLR
ncbi:MAG: type II toxin-antitoxin system VapC family toxin [Pirellulaceae bacterium]|nr:type II toxin-antitoxin system VapC family toxin [Pirellulaceae bacterium]